MLYRDRLQSELLDQKEAFAEFSRTQSEEISALLGLLSRFSRTDPDRLAAMLEDKKDTGALPSPETDGRGSISRPFGPRWSDHEQARRWAGDVLKGRTTFAADGSQLYVEKETSLPVGAIQVGWFENPHDPAKPYEKDASFELLSPSDLLSDGEEPANPETRIGERRFHAEVKRVREFIDKKRGWEKVGEPMPLAFFDGTLLVSFSLPQTRLQKSFIDVMVDLVEASKANKVPLVGYIDRSLSRDLANLLSAFGGRERSGPLPVTDPVVLSAAPKVLDGWGDRTDFFYSNRRGMDAFADPEGGRSSVGFFYLSTSSGLPPARLDVPSWVFESGFLDEVADIVRAECVIGLGYPYPIEAADATALISPRDRRIFLKALQDFAVREKLNFSVSNKDSSKRRRR